jgi:8-amino-7-oxononanoate synthase
MPMSVLDNFLSARLRRQEEEGLLRKLTHPNGLIDFSSNDYLGLARSHELFDLIKQKVEALPHKFNGATGSRLLSGNSLYYEAVEQKLAKIFKSESALIFNSGYAANQAVLSSLPQKGDIILYDELAHACIKDGARLSLATRYSFRHNDLEDLERKIKRSKVEKIFIAVESIYSMDGDECPLPELVRLAQAYNAIIVLDEAHSTGVIGDQGNGLAVTSKISDHIHVRIHTFGKAMGVHGACVAGSIELTKYLINFSRPFIYTTALPPHTMATIESAFDYLRQHPELQSKLRSRVELFLQHATFSNRTLSHSAIQTVIIPSNQDVKKTALSLQQKGFDVRPILSPTVAKNSERLRICLHSYNTDEEIINLVTELKKHC